MIDAARKRAAIHESYEHAERKALFQDSDPALHRVEKLSQSELEAPPPPVANASSRAPLYHPPGSQAPLHGERTNTSACANMTSCDQALETPVKYSLDFENGHDSRNYETPSALALDLTQ